MSGAFTGQYACIRQTIGVLAPHYKLHIVWLFRHGNMTAVNLDLSFVYTYKNPNNKQVINFIPEIVPI